MKKILPLTFVLCMFASSNANAWFFFFLPLPGSKSEPGDTCVAENRKVGDTIRSVNGNIATITVISGTSSRCKKPELPILATVDYSTSTTFSSKAGINLPDSYKAQALQQVQSFNGMLLYAKNNDVDSGVIIESVKRSVISDIPTYAKNLKTAKTKTLDDTEQSEIAELNINGMNAWQFETRGKLKNLFGTRYTYLTTVLEGDNEVIKMDVFAASSNYLAHSAELKQLAYSVTGIKATPLETAASIPPPGTPPPAIAPVPPAAAQTSAPPVTSAATVTPTGATPVIEPAADRLRDLNKLYKEGVITQKEFEDKKKEILKAM
jgi:hypothetical protein